MLMTPNVYAAQASHTVQTNSAASESSTAAPGVAFNGRQEARLPPEPATAQPSGTQAPVATSKPGKSPTSQSGTGSQASRPSADNVAFNHSVALQLAVSQVCSRVLTLQCIALQHASPCLLALLLSLLGRSTQASPARLRSCLTGCWPLVQRSWVLWWHEGQHGRCDGSSRVSAVAHPSMPDHAALLTYLLACDQVPLMIFQWQ